MLQGGRLAGRTNSRRREFDGTPLPGFCTLEYMATPLVRRLLGFRSDARASESAADGFGGRTFFEAAAIQRVIDAVWARGDWLTPT